MPEQVARRHVVEVGHHPVKPVPAGQAALRSIPNVRLPSRASLAALPGNIIRLCIAAHDMSASRTPAKSAVAETDCHPTLMRGPKPMLCAVPLIGDDDTVLCDPIPAAGLRGMGGLGHFGIGCPTASAYRAPLRNVRETRDSILSSALAIRSDRPHLVIFRRRRHSVYLRIPQSVRTADLGECFGLAFFRSPSRIRVPRWLPISVCGSGSFQLHWAGCRSRFRNPGDRRSSTSGYGDQVAAPDERSGRSRSLPNFGDRPVQNEKVIPMLALFTSSTCAKPALTLAPPPRSCATWAPNASIFAPMSGSLFA